MDTTWTPDQLQFRETVDRFLGAKSPTSVVRTLMESPVGYDPAVWTQLSAEMGLTGTHLPERYGGYGFGPVELGIICEAMGRHLYCGPYFASAVMAGHALLAAAESHRERLIPGIASGETIAALVLDDLGDPDRVGQSLRASGAAGASRLDGTARIVVDAHVADLLVVAASDASGVALYAVDPGADGVTITPVQSLDPTRKLSRVTFADAPAERIGDPPVDLHALWDRLAVALAHEMIGGAQRLFDSTVEYLKIRVQFGRPIGSFQALKHRCADLLAQLELAKAATYAAAQQLATGEGDAYAPNMAKAMASDTYVEVAKQAIQLRGGIGFTWEDDTHLWFKRAKSSEVFLGTPAWHRERMIQKLEAEHA